MSCSFCSGSVPHPAATNSYQEYLNEVEQVWNSQESTRWRRGQTLFNVLYRLNPTLADEVRGRDIDPFHLDVRIDAFLTFIKERMDP